MPTRLLVTATAASQDLDEIYHQIVDFVSKSASAPDENEVIQTNSLSGSSVSRAIQKPKEALKEVTTSLHSIRDNDLIIKGIGSTPAPSFDVFGWNLDVATNAGAAVVIVVNGAGMSPELLHDEVQTALHRASRHHAEVCGIIVSGTSKSGLPDADVPLFSLPLESQAAKVLAETTVSSVTPLSFQSDLIARAKATKRTIVLPESDEPRVLAAAAKLLADDVVNLVLIGDEDEVSKRASDLDVDVSAARIVSINDAELSEKYAAEFAQIRSHKGVSLDEARAKMQDVTYFATMMVQMGDADGMVSGAVHTTAETIVPAFQIIKTAPGVSIVSSSFLMLMADHVLVMGDCAVNTNPTADQLADIAVSTAATATAFGLTPKIAMLSYSTGTSGTGTDVDLVREATKKLTDSRPDLSVVGPIQYDAAVTPEVAALKAPDSDVAGHANVLVFPSLSAGNIGYKAVQRSADAVAVGPILQGLRRPVNDLSRGATIEDIVNTVAITAVQAQD